MSNPYIAVKQKLPELNLEQGLIVQLREKDYQIQYLQKALAEHKEQETTLNNTVDNIMCGLDKLGLGYNVARKLVVLKDVEKLRSLLPYLGE